jgi:hypothetical protein
MKVWPQHHYRWAIGPSSRPEPPKCAVPSGAALSLCSDRSDTLSTWAIAGWQAGVIGYLACHIPRRVHPRCQAEADVIRYTTAFRRRPGLGYTDAFS